jgi:hypothetical protein
LRHPFSFLFVPRIRVCEQLRRHCQRGDVTPIIFGDTANSTAFIDLPVSQT